MPIRYASSKNNLNIPITAAKNDLYSSILFYPVLDFANYIRFSPSIYKTVSLARY